MSRAGSSPASTEDQQGGRSSETYRKTFGRYQRILERAQHLSDEVAGTFDAVKESLAAHDHTNTVSFFSKDDHERVERLLHETAIWQVVVVGEVNAGKSTLWNLLLGADILPVARLACTARLVRLRYGEQRRLKLVYHTGEEEEKILDGGGEEIKQYVQLEGKSRSRRESPHVRARTNIDLLCLFRDWGSPLPHHLHGARPCHICNGTGPNPGHLHRDWTQRCCRAHNAPCSHRSRQGMRVHPAGTNTIA
jgi:hypothetical protein